MIPKKYAWINFTLFPTCLKEKQAMDQPLAAVLASMSLRLTRLPTGLNVKSPYLSCWRNPMATSRALYRVGFFLSLNTNLLLRILVPNGTSSLEISTKVPLSCSTVISRSIASFHFSHSSGPSRMISSSVGSSFMTSFSPLKSCLIIALNSNSFIISWCSSTV